MIDALSTSLSGLTAASQRVAVAADNIANQRSTAVTRADAPHDQRDAPNAPTPPPANGGVNDDTGDKGSDNASARVENARFAPRQVVQSTREGGGTVARTRAVDPPSVPRFEPTAPDADAAGITQRPNIAIERELAELSQSQRAFEASLTALDTTDKMLGRLIDIRS